MFDIEFKLCAFLLGSYLKTSSADFLYCNGFVDERKGLRDRGFIYCTINAVSNDFTMNIRHSSEFSDANGTSN